MMLLERSLLQEFILFITEMYSVQVISPSTPRFGEFARFLIKDNFYVVREISGEEVTDSVNLEVFCADKQVLQKLEETWGQYLFASMKQDTESPPINPEIKEETNESGSN